MTDSSAAAAHRHVVFMPLCGASPLMSAVLDLLVSAQKKTKTKMKESPPDWLSRYQQPNLRRNKEWRRQSRGEVAEMNLLKLIQDGSGVCWQNWRVFWRCGENWGVCTSDCQCGGTFYTRREGVGEYRERNTLSGERGSREGGSHYRFLGSNFSVNIIKGWHLVAVSCSGFFSPTLETSANPERLRKNVLLNAWMICTVCLCQAVTVAYPELFITNNKKQ